MAEKKVQKQREIKLNDNANLPEDLPDKVRDQHLKTVRVRDYRRRPPTRKVKEITEEEVLGGEKDPEAD